MTDVIALALLRKRRLEAEIERLNQFLKVAEELLIGASPAMAARQRGADGGTGDAPARAEAITDPSRIPTAALFQKMLAEQRAKRQGEDGEVLHFEQPSTAAHG